MVWGGEMFWWCMYVCACILDPLLFTNSFGGVFCTSALLLVVGYVDDAAERHTD